jgi:hypothetical protein
MAVYTARTNVDGEDMARKEVEVRMPEVEGNRDSGKLYLLKEMPASKAEKWATRAMLAIGKSGLHVTDGAGMAELAAISIRYLFGASFQDVEPLMEEMFACVSIYPDPTKMRNPIARPLVEEDIEEVSTRFMLRNELIALHTGFFLPGFPSISVPWAKPLFTPNTETSPEQ